MNGRGCAARCVLVTGLLALVLPAARTTASVGRADLARCAAIASADVRLACYDTLAGRAPAAATPATPGGSAPRAAPDDGQSFGLSPAQRPLAPQGPDSIKARVAQVTADRLGNVTVQLDNGQTWVLAEPDLKLRPGDAVTIRRAALGSFMMTTPSKRAYHVRRTQ